MSTEDILQNMISALGQSQGDRPARELDDHFVDVDERTPRDLLVLSRALAAHVRHYGVDADGKLVAGGDFSSFFPFGGASAPGDASFPALAAVDAAKLLATTEGDQQPHLALFAAFLELYEKPRALLNRITARHLEFYYGTVLQFKPRPAVPDRAHVVFELKKNAPPVRVLPDLVLSAGKDAKGAARLYQPVREVVIGGAKVDQVCSTFVADKVYCAPVARSGDGAGGPAPDETGGAGAPKTPGWAPFGNDTMPVGAVGFALSSPVLRLSGATRTITSNVKLASGTAELDTALLASSVEAFFTGEKTWLGPYPIEASLSGDLLQITMKVSGAEPAIVDYDPAVHGASFAADAPVVQLVLKHDAAGAYARVKSLFVGSLHLTVDVEGLTALTLESDLGALDPKKAFMPFGPEAQKGARFMIGCPEALSKTLSKLSLTIRWHGLPNLEALYADYPGAKIKPESFTALASFRDGTGVPHDPPALQLFTSDGVIALTPFSAPLPLYVSPALQIYALHTAGSQKLAQLARIPLVTRPMLHEAKALRPVARAGFITLVLDRGFLHDVYRLETLKRAGKATKENPFVPLNEPYTPFIEGISLTYTASTTDVDLTVTSPDGFASPDIRFFHVDGFGQRREHAYLRKALAHVADQRVPLFPTHDDEGELLIGLTGLAAGDGVSILVEVAEGSADPDLVVWPEIAWSVLADNHWKLLEPGALVLDTTNALCRSGLVVVVVPREATTTNTLLPAGRVWLKAAVKQDAGGVSRLVDVIANGAEVRFVDHDNDPAHLASALPARSINKLKTPLASVKGVIQPEASFGGRPTESAAALTTRAAERLRHKSRAITPWDYERIVLEAFPSIHRVKCIPHAKRGSWLSPGNVLLVVVPDLRNKNARNPLAPRVDPDTLASIAEHVRARAGMGVGVAAVNPTYQKVRLDFEVKLRRGHPWNTYRPLLAQEITAFLSPWAFDAERPISFGESIYKSVLLDFVEERSYVDYLTVFKMYSYTDDLTGAVDIDEATPARPDAILVSDDEHVINEIT